MDGLLERHKAGQADGSKEEKKVGKNGTGQDATRYGTRGCDRPIEQEMERAGGGRQDCIGSERHAAGRFKDDGSGAKVTRATKRTHFEDGLFQRLTQRVLRF